MYHRFITIIAMSVINLYAISNNFLFYCIFGKFDLNCVKNVIEEKNSISLQLWLISDNYNFLVRITFFYKEMKNICEIQDNLSTYNKI